MIFKSSEMFLWEETKSVLKGPEASVGGWVLVGIQVHLKNMNQTNYKLFTSTETEDGFGTLWAIFLIILDWNKSFKLKLTLK